jgi:hypothetical protein
MVLARRHLTVAQETLYCDKELKKHGKANWRKNF